MWTQRQFLHCLSSFSQELQANMHIVIFVIYSITWWNRFLWETNHCFRRLMEKTEQMNDDKSILMLFVPHDKRVRFILATCGSNVWTLPSHNGIPVKTMFFSFCVCSDVMCRRVDSHLYTYMWACHVSWSWAIRQILIQFKLFAIISFSCCFPAVGFVFV